MASWSYCRKFDEFQFEENKALLVGRAGVYQFGFFYFEEFLPKYIGRVVWTSKAYDFYQRFLKYKNGSHNPYVAKKIAAQRKMLWFRVMVVPDPSWTESRYLLDDLNSFGQFDTFEWNNQGSNVAATRDRIDFRQKFAAYYDT
ncbi:MAG: hypothetical protein ACRERU_19935 [Methylococcales bacterium]